MTEYLKEQLEHKETGELYHTVAKIAKKSSYENALEVGMAWAITTLAILRNGTGKLLSVDKSFYPNTADQVSRFGFSHRWTPLIKDSRQALPELAGYFDLICVDGDHCYEFVKSDLLQAARLLTQDGTIIVDDYLHRYNTEKDYGVTKAVDEIVKEFGFKIKVHKKAHGIVELTR